MKGIALMTKYRSWLRIGLLVVAVCAAPTLAWAQAAISGVVTDESRVRCRALPSEAASPALIEKVRTVYPTPTGRPAGHCRRVRDFRWGAQRIADELGIGHGTVQRELERTGRSQLPRAPGDDRCNAMKRAGQASCCIWT